MSDAVEPLPERIEFTDRHDPYVNRAFLAIFEHPENAEIARAFTVGLPTADPERPSTVEEGSHTERPATAAGAFEAPAPHAIRYVDFAGDPLTLISGEHECETHGTEPFVSFVSGEDGEPVVVAHEHLPRMIAWLSAAYERGQKAKREGGR